MQIIKSRLTAVVAGAAVLVTLGGIGGAVAAEQITGRDIKDQSIKKIDVGPKAVGRSELTPKMRAKIAKVGEQGEAGPAGADGTNGVDGKDGTNGFTGLQYVTFDYIAGKESTDAEPGMGADYTGAGSGGIATIVCPADKTAVSGGVQFLGLDADNGNKAVAGGSGIVDSFPGRMDWSTNTPRPNRTDGWIVRLNKNAAGEPLRLWTVCVTN